MTVKVSAMLSNRLIARALAVVIVTTATLGQLTTATAQEIAARNAAPGTVAFPKFSPLPGHRSPALDDPTPQQAEFGVPLRVLAFSERALQMNDGTKTFWVDRADVLTLPSARYLDSAPGYKLKERPRIRFWRSVSSLTEFLSRADLNRAGAEFEEIIIEKPRHDLKLPILAEDFADVLGERTVEVAAVMVPILKPVAEKFDKARKVSGTTHRITFVLDVSGDAKEFTQDSFHHLQRLLERRLADSGASYHFRAVFFGSQYRRGYVTSNAETLSEIAREMHRIETGRSDFLEPLLAGLHGAELDDAGASGFDSAAVVILSGGNLKAEMLDTSRGTVSSLAAPGLELPNNTVVIAAKVTSEPGDDLRHLAAATFGDAGTVYIDYGPTLSNDLVAEISAVLRPDDERLLTLPELTNVCAPAVDARRPCILPFEPSTGTPLPQPTRRALHSDWYSTVLWVVRDGDVLRKSDTN
ncbi:hypothetical protein KUV47_09090 [Vannielia litorea]|uniref:hypothetical protein n=1 Tax=Vannielia litorea TaxID=1217970 RepID=UPI001C985607|nr:hypothetical protein [Vannielia litorea]MBY6153366.1 hypothetical protein [Vannielia litorea]